MKRKTTSRGFRIYGEFKDSYHSTVRIQESSAAGALRVWIFCKNHRGEDAVTCVGAPGSVSAVSPHLTRAQARRVAKALLEFAK